ncbi:MAG TPA: HAMP domain-containing sensor histidine kinase, partial [Aggregatilineales bacterium]|nr:HAMP domain-containing sensor histidine kinase [Aggregatilineales bacterium]
EQQINNLKEINRLKDEFVRMVSHDLKNPLFVLMGYLHILELSDFMQGAEAQDYLGEMKKSTGSMKALIENLLDLSKIEAGMSITPEPILLARFLEDSLQGFDMLAGEKSIEVVFTPPPDVTVNVDAARMGQVLNNLLSNAVKYTPEGGRVELRGMVDNDYTLIQVMDTGYGIPAEDVPHLFERFYRVKRDEHMKSEGTGLGLAIVKAIVEQHGGEIWVESELGSGSTFNIQIPLTG